MCAREGRTVLREVDRVRGMLRRAWRDILMVALVLELLVEMVPCMNRRRLMVQG